MFSMSSSTALNVELSNSNAHLITPIATKSMHSKAEHKETKSMTTSHYKEEYNDDFTEE